MEEVLVIEDKKDEKFKMSSYNYSKIFFTPFIFSPNFLISFSFFLSFFLTNKVLNIIFEQPRIKINRVTDQGSAILLALIGLEAVENSGKSLFKKSSSLEKE